jgi:hypothetical protein
MYRMDVHPPDDHTLRIDADFDQIEVASREGARANPDLHPIKISALARASWAKLTSMTPGALAEEAEQKHQLILSRMRQVAETGRPLRCCNKMILDSSITGPARYCPILIQYPDGEIAEWLTVRTQRHWDWQIDMTKRGTFHDPEERIRSLREQAAPGVTQWGVNLPIETLTMEQLDVAAKQWMTTYCPEILPRLKIEWLSEQDTYHVACLHTAREHGFATYEQYREFLDQELAEFALVDDAFETPSIRERVLRMVHRLRMLLQSLCVWKRG